MRYFVFVLFFCGCAANNEVHHKMIVSTETIQPPEFKEPRMTLRTTYERTW